VRCVAFFRLLFAACARVRTVAHLALPRLISARRPARRACNTRSNADREATDADGKSAVELALERDATALLMLLTDAAAASARLKEVQKLMLRSRDADWARKRRISPLGCACSACTGRVHTRKESPDRVRRVRVPGRSWLVVVATLALWALLLLGIFVSLAPKRAEARAHTRKHTTFRH
jgi:hypothetical protein